jgi:predicted ATPase
MFLLWKIDMWIMNVSPQKLVIKPVINLISGDYGVGKSTPLLQVWLN